MSDLGVPVTIPSPPAVELILRAYTDVDSLIDRNSEIHTKLRWEWYHTPYNHPDSSYSEKKASFDEQACIVYIREFTTDNLDFAYYIKGLANLGNFLSGTFGMQAYDAEIFATPIVLHDEEELVCGPNIIQVHQQVHNRVCKHGPITEQVRWRYLFETARLVWSRFEFDSEQLQELEREKHRTPSDDYDMEDSIDDSEEQDEARDRNTGVDWEVSSVSSTEAEEIEDETSEKKRGKMKLTELEEPEYGIEKTRELEEDLIMIPTITLAEAHKEAIRRNLNELKQTGDDVAAYLTEQIIARQKWDGQIKLTQAQQSVVTGLTDVIRLIADLDQRKNELGLADSTGRGIFAEMEDSLHRERESLISTYQEHLHRGMEDSEVVETIEATDTDSLSDLQQVALMDFMEVTDQSIEASVRTLAENDWDAQDAIANWVDRESLKSGSKDGDFARAVLESSEWLRNNDESSNVTELPKSAQSDINSRPFSYAEAGPSNKRQALDTPEELTASRARLEELIFQGQQTRNSVPARPLHDENASSKTCSFPPSCIDTPPFPHQEAIRTSETQNSISGVPNSKRTLRFKQPIYDESPKRTAKQYTETKLSPTTVHDQHRLEGFGQPGGTSSSTESPNHLQERNPVGYARGDTPMPSQPARSLDAIDTLLSSSSIAPPASGPPRDPAVHPSPIGTHVTGKRKRQRSESTQPTRSGSTTQPQLLTNSLANNPPLQQQYMTVAEALIQAEQERRDSAIDPKLQSIKWQDQESFELDRHGQMRRKSDQRRVRMVTTKRRQVKVIEDPRISEDDGEHSEDEGQQDRH